MKISKKTQYGLRAMVYLAEGFGQSRVFPLKEISQEEGIPFDFLEKIFSKLEKVGLVKAKKGIRGGYFLARSPGKISIGEIIKVLEGTMAPVLCVAKEKEKRIFCPRKKTCKTFDLWRKIQDILTFTLDSISLTDLIKSQKLK